MEDLVDRIERVHVESEVAKQRLREAVESLHALVTPARGADPVSAYATLVAALGRSDEQAERLRKAIEPMKEVAEPIFEQWQADMDAFTNPQLRERSQARLKATRERYDAIVAAVDPALEAYVSFNQVLRDQTLFLRHDFNAAALSAIQNDVQVLGQLAGELDRRFDACLLSSRTYVESAALPMRLEMSRAARPSR